MGVECITMIAMMDFFLVGDDDTVDQQCGTGFDANYKCVKLLASGVMTEVANAAEEVVDGGPNCDVELSPIKGETTGELENFDG